MDLVPVPNFLHKVGGSLVQLPLWAKLAWGFPELQLKMI